MSEYLTLLWWLLVAHAITDAWLQMWPLGGRSHQTPVLSVGVLKDPTSRENPVPSHWPYWMFLHGVTNGLGVYLVTHSLVCMIGETVLHSLVDLGKCHHRYNVHVDQGLHLATKLLWATLVVSGILKGG